MIDRIRYEDEGKNIRPDPQWVTVHIKAREFVTAGIINTTEYCVLEEIGTLFNEKKGGCYASNERIGYTWRLSPHTISLAITKLKRVGLARAKNLPGKKRILVTFWNDPDLFNNAMKLLSNNKTAEFRRGETVAESRHSSSGIPPQTMAEFRHHNIEENKEENKMNFRKPKIRVTASSSSKTKHSGKVQLTDFDKKQGCVLRSILETSGNKLLAGLKRESYARMISRLINNLTVSEKEIEEMLSWLTEAYGQDFVPTIFKKDDLITKWDNFVAAKNRWKGKQAEENEIDCRKVNYKEMDMMDPRMRAMSEKVGILRGWFKENVEYWQMGNRACSDDLKRACDELGFDVNTIDSSFI